MKTIIKTLVLLFLVSCSKESSTQIENTEQLESNFEWSVSPEITYYYSQYTEEGLIHVTLKEDEDTYIIDEFVPEEELQVTNRAVFNNFDLNVVVAILYTDEGYTVVLHNSQHPNNDAIFEIN